MHQVAVYNAQQHEQFRRFGNRLALYKTSEGLWQQTAQAKAPELSFQTSNNTVTFDAIPTDLQLADDRSLKLGETLQLPCMLSDGTTWLEITPQPSPRNLEPLKQTNLDKLLQTQSSNKSHLGPASATVTKWLTEAGQLHRAAAGSPQFYVDAARFAVEIIGLDAAWILQRNEENKQTSWRIAASHIPNPELGICFDEQTLETAITQQGTWYQPSSQTQDGSPAVMIAPVLDNEGKLIAAIYGTRNTQAKNRRRGIRPLEARLTQLLAESVAIGVTRLQKETAAARSRVLLEQAFSQTVVEYIEQHPESLVGQQRDVTLLFADLRGYTTLAETMLPANCYALLGDVLESLTQVVTRQRGVIVDYYGDGLLALWNAPLNQPNHADLACTAAIEMLADLPTVAKKWQHCLTGPLELGIGIHSGPAYVGNAGTRSRIKYGPRGNTVNVASRVQSACKQLGLPLVITDATKAMLSDKFFSLRVCKAKLPGLERPADLFTTYPTFEATQLKSRLDQYAEALTLFEAGELEQAEALLKELTVQSQVAPAHFLARYTAIQQKNNPGRRAVDKYAAQHGPIIEIHSK